MTQENKDLLLRDLSARLCCGVKIHIESCGEIWDDILDSISIGKADSTPITYINRTVVLENCICKPYLRLMSSMTEEEKMIQRSKMRHEGYFVNPIYFHTIEEFDYLNSIHADYRGLIEKGLALEAPEGMYNLKEK